MGTSLQAYSIKLQPKIVKEIDEIVKEGFATSRNEFLREAATKHLMEIRRELIRADVHKQIQKFKSEAKVHPKTPFIPREEKIKIANELLKEKGLL